MAESGAFVAATTPTGPDPDRTDSDRTDANSTYPSGTHAGQASVGGNQSAPAAHRSLEHSRLEHSRLDANPVGTGRIGTSRIDTSRIDTSWVDTSRVDPSAPDHSNVDTVAALRAAVLVLARRLRYQIAGDDDLSATELAVLGRIGRCGPMTPGQLARAEHVRPPSMTKVIESLEGRGMLSREPHPTDRRQYLVSRTEAAEAFVEASRQIRTVWLANHLAQLTDSERAAIEAAIPALSRLAELP